MKYTYDVTTRKYSKGTNSKKYIMLHHTGGVTTLANMTNYLAKNSAQVSAHYVIGKNGGISRIGTDNYILWHAGLGSKIPGVVNNMNAHSIGIEVVSNGVNFTEAQVIALAELVKHLQKTHKIKPQNIIRHKDYSTRKWDIGDNFYKVVGCKSYSEWIENHILEKPVGDYRKLAGKSHFSKTEQAGITLVTGDPDERMAVVQLMARKTTESVLKKHGLIK